MLKMIKMKRIMFRAVLGKTNLIAILVKLNLNMMMLRRVRIKIK